LLSSALALGLNTRALHTRAPHCTPKLPSSHPFPADTFIQKTKKLYADTQTQRNMAMLMGDLNDVSPVESVLDGSAVSVASSPQLVRHLLFRSNLMAASCSSRLTPS
jgi:hypothetical protein